MKNEMGSYDTKKLEEHSEYEKYDLDHDGVVSDDELKTSEKLVKLKNSDALQDQQRLMCWVSLLSVIFIIIALLSPFVSLERIESITAFLSTYTVATMGIIATFMATHAWSRKSEQKD